MDKIILHCDMNNFFASVECARNKELAGLPVAVCGSVEDRCGIVLAKNDLAKKFGVKTAETIWQAKQKCPDLVCVKPHMDDYSKISKYVFNIYCEYTDLVEPFGIDECWLDVTNSTLLFGDGYNIAYTVKERIKAELGLTISVGVSFTKIFAKLGSDIKKPDAITCITRENYKGVAWCLPACDMLGVGGATFKTLTKFGINTIGDIANCKLCDLQELLGKNGEAIYHCATGEAVGTIAHQDARRVPKSVGNSMTTRVDMTNRDAVWKIMFSLAESVCTRLREQGLLAGGVHISVKDTNLSTKGWQAPLSVYTRHPHDLAKSGMELFDQHCNFALPVRAVGITAINLVMDDQAIQMSLLNDQEKTDELEQLEQKVFSLRKRYGDDAVFRASLL